MTIPTALAEEIKHKMPCLTQVFRKIYHTLKGIGVTGNFGLGSLKYGYPERRRMARSKLFLSLDDAVEVVTKRLDCRNDKVIVRQELEQKCYLNTSNYEIGFSDGLEAVQKAIEAIDKQEFDKWLEGRKKK